MYNQSSFFQKEDLFVFLALYLDKKIFFSTFANVRVGGNATA